MAMLAWLMWAICAGLQEPSETERNRIPPPVKNVELRIYFTAPAPPKTAPDQKDVAPEDLSLLLAMTSAPNKARTFAMERVVLKEGESPVVGTHSQIRKLEGTAYFARLVITGPDEAEKEKSAEKAAPSPESTTPPFADGATEASRAKLGEPGAVLKRVYFRVQLRSDELPKSFKASLTLRAGSRTFSARTYGYPFSGAGDAAYGRMESSLKEILTAMDTAAFGRIPTLTVKISDDLDELAAVTVEDASGEKEYDRQWCQALAKRIERASYTGDDDIRSLAQQFQVRLRRLKEGPRGAPAAPPSKEAPAPEKPQDSEKK